MFAKNEEKTSHRFGIVVLKTEISVSRPIENSGVEWVYKHGLINVAHPLKRTNFQNLAPGFENQNRGSFGIDTHGD